MLNNAFTNLLKISKELHATFSFQTVKDFVGSSDLNDDYRFSLTGRSSVSLSLQDLSANSDLQLVQDRNSNSQIDVGELVADLTQSGRYQELVGRILDSGTYYIRVCAASPCQNTTYGLSFNAVKTGQINTDVNGDGKGTSSVEITKGDKTAPTLPISTPPISTPPIPSPPISTLPLPTLPISVKAGPGDLFALSSNQQQTRLGVNLKSTNYQASGNTFVRANNDPTFWCTEYAYGRAIEKGLFADGKGIGASIWGDAGSWDDDIGLSNVKAQARANSFIIWDSNQAGAGSAGHVGFVEEVYANGSFLISEANWNGQDFNLRLINPGSLASVQAKFIYL